MPEKLAPNYSITYQIKTINGFNVPYNLISPCQENIALFVKELYEALNPNGKLKKQENLEKLMEILDFNQNEETKEFSFNIPYIDNEERKILNIKGNFINDHHYMMTKKEGISIAKKIKKIIVDGNKNIKAKWTDPLLPENKKSIKAVISIASANKSELGYDKTKEELGDEPPSALVFMGLQYLDFNKDKLIKDPTAYNLRITNPDAFMEIMKDLKRIYKYIYHLGSDVDLAYTRNDDTYICLPNTLRHLNIDIYKRKMQALLKELESHEVQNESDMQNYLLRDIELLFLHNKPCSLYFSAEDKAKGKEKLIKEITERKNIYRGLKNLEKIIAQAEKSYGVKNADLLLQNISASPYAAFWPHDLFTYLFFMDVLKKNGHNTVYSPRLITDPKKDVDDLITILYIVEELLLCGTMEGLPLENELTIVASTDVNDERYHFIEEIIRNLKNKLKKQYGGNGDQETDPEKIQINNKIEERFNKIRIEKGLEATNKKGSQYYKEKNGCIIDFKNSSATVPVFSFEEKDFYQQFDLEQNGSDKNELEEIRYILLGYWNKYAEKCQYEYSENNSSNNINTPKISRPSFEIIHQEWRHRLKEKPNRNTISEFQKELKTINQFHNDIIELNKKYTVLSEYGDFRLSLEERKNKNSSNQDYYFLMLHSLLLLEFLNSKENFNGKKLFSETIKSLYSGEFKIKIETPYEMNIRTNLSALKSSWNEINENKNLFEEAKKLIFQEIDKNLNHKSSEKSEKNSENLEKNHELITFVKGLVLLSRDIEKLNQKPKEDPLINIKQKLFEMKAKEINLEKNPAEIKDSLWFFLIKKEETFNPSPCLENIAPHAKNKKFSDLLPNSQQEILFVMLAGALRWDSSTQSDYIKNQREMFKKFCRENINIIEALCTWFMGNLDGIKEKALMPYNITGLLHYTCQGISTSFSQKILGMDEILNVFLPYILEVYEKRNRENNNSSQFKANEHQIAQAIELNPEIIDELLGNGKEKTIPFIDFAKKEHIQALHQRLKAYLNQKTNKKTNNPKKTKNRSTSCLGFFNYKSPNRILYETSKQNRK